MMDDPRYDYYKALRPKYEIGDTVLVKLAKDAEPTEAIITAVSCPRSVGLDEEPEKVFYLLEDPEGEVIFEDWIVALVSKKPAPRHRIFQVLHELTKTLGAVAADLDINDKAEAARMLASSYALVAEAAGRESTQ